MKLQDFLTIAAGFCLMLPLSHSADEICVQTGTYPDAGTWLHVVIKLYGDGQSVKTYTLGSPQQSEIPAGSYKCFTVNHPNNLGTRIRKIKIRLDTTQSDNDWYLVRVDIHYNSSCFTFHYNQWQNNQFKERSASDSTHC